MATFAELVSDVAGITNRPDLAATDIKRAVKVATLKMHTLDYFPRDIAESGLQWNPADYIQSLDYKTLFPRWRSLKYLRKYDLTTSPGTPGKFFHVVIPEKVIDEYGVDRIDVCYLAGAELQIKSATQDQYMLIGFYQYPILDEATYDSWVAREFPYAIEFEAAKQIFKQIGFQEQSAQMDKEVAEQIALVTISGLQAQGY